MQIKEDLGLGIKVNIWTVNSEEIMEEKIKSGIDYVTTNEPVLLQQMLLKFAKIKLRPFSCCNSENRFLDKISCKSDFIITTMLLI